MPDPGRIRVKICGVRQPQDVTAAAEAGAAYLGFVFVDRSPRVIAPGDAAALAALVPAGIAKVALTMDADNDTLDTLLAQVPIDMLQLHGDETPERVVEVKARTGLPVMKAIGIAGPEDLAQIDRYALAADQLLVDTKAPDAGALPGGSGKSFDWGLLANRRWPVPWMLAGGLTPVSVGEAISRTSARQVDISSGVEVTRGVKDPDLIRAFVAAAQDHPVPV